tara:strand:+ start:213 stop:1235 length:1023 start_codon:yes stop_codon:yes gene_type:complete
MIAKIIKGKDFYGVLAYNDQKVGQGSAHIIDANIGLGSTIQNTNTFNTVRALRPNLGKAVLHVSLNLPYQDKLSDKEFAKLGHDYLKEMGFDDNQYIIYRHHDQKHQHIHIIANRVGYSGKVVSDAKDLFRSKKILRKLEVDYKLTQLDGTIVKKESPISQQEIEKALRTGNAPIRYILLEKVKHAIHRSEDTQGFIEKLHIQNVRPRFNVSSTTGRVSGISFDYEGTIYKGSTLGRGYSWNAIIKHIDYEQDRDRAIVLQTNSAEQRDFRGINSDKEGAGENPEQSKSTIGGAGEIVGQPKDDLGLSEKDILGPEPINSYRNELDGPLWRRRRKKGRSR